MSIRTVRDCAFATVALLALLSGVETVLGQQEVQLGAWQDIPSDISLGTVTQVAPTDSALTSTEQGATPLDQSFDLRQWRLEKRRKALEDTTFEINFRTFYFDRSDFDSAEKQAWAIGGWVGLKTGYFLDHIAFGIDRLHFTASVCPCGQEWKPPPPS